MAKQIYIDKNKRLTDRGFEHLVKSLVVTAVGVGLSKSDNSLLKCMGYGTVVMGISQGISIFRTSHREVTDADIQSI